MRSSVLLCVGLVLVVAVAVEPAAPDTRQSWHTNDLQTPPPATAAAAATSTSATSTSGGAGGGGGGGGGSCTLTLRPSGQCSGSGEDGEAGSCPYQLTLPPLTLQLPEQQLRVLERTVQELRSLKEAVGRLQKGCTECRRGGGGGGGVGGGGAGGGGAPGTTHGDGELLQQQQQQQQQGQQQADQGSPGGGERPSADPQDLPGSSTEEPGGDPACADGTSGSGAAAGHCSTGETSSNMIEMQVKLNRMSASLRNARSQITVLHGRMEGLKLLNMDNVQALVDRKVENITGMVNKLRSTCISCNSQEAEGGKSHFMGAPRDCSEYTVLEERKNGVYRITPDGRNGTFETLCEMESYGSGWTVIQQRLDGSVSFNRTWADYKKGFGNLRGEFWLGNDHIHMLTKAKAMVLRIDLEDFEGVHEYASYDHFYVSNEFLRYRLTIGGYGGTAGNAISYNKHFDHDHKFFTTPDRDHDMYPSGNCGAYYGSGWWFDACMSANLNGKYYHKRYKGVRNGIFWGTWHNMSSEYYPTNYRQAFKMVRMMIRPKNYAP